MRTIQLVGLVGALALGAIGLACGDAEQPPTGPGGTGAGTGDGGSGATGAGTTTHDMGGMGGTGGMTMSGGGGAGGAMCVAAECPGIENECHQKACIDGMCGFMDAPEGTILGAQTPGNCQKAVCDGMGSFTMQDDDTDPFNDLNDCTADTCAAGMIVNDAEPAGTSCMTNGGKVCDGAKNCVACVVGADCPSGVCAPDHTCVDAQCGDMFQNGLETDVDCGGPACGKCENLKMCGGNGDCQSAVCSLGVCQVPTCTDATKNAAETDVDCGGPMCPDCGTDKMCASPNDCISGVCSGMPLKCAMATCTDVVKNGGEGDVDCGAVCPTKCAAGKTCGGNADCAGNLCTGGICQPTCNDGVKNGAEGDIDCGAVCPAKCATGKMCGGNTDCISNSCVGGICQPSCNDGVKNGMETDVDCGGMMCPDCAVGKLCGDGFDCQSGICAGTPEVCATSINGCTLAAAQDFTAQANTTIQFGFVGGMFNVYSPACIKVKSGNMVTFTGAGGTQFFNHPLQGGSITNMNMTATPDLTGPWPVQNSAMMTTQSYTMPTATSTVAFGYYCAFHYFGGMYGAVFVVP